MTVKLDTKLKPGVFKDLCSIVKKAHGIDYSKQVFDELEELREVAYLKGAQDEAKNIKSEIAHMLKRRMADD